MWSLIHTQPKRRALETRSARPTSRVQTDEASPYGVPLAHAIASSSSEKGWTVITGPKISRWIISSSCCRPATTVGSRKKPGRSGSAPPVTTSACPGLRSRKPSTRSRWRAEFSGPSVVSGGERVADHEPLGLRGQPADDVVVDLRRPRARASPPCSPGRRCSSRCPRWSPAPRPSSTSSNTTTGALPPSSRCTRLSVGAARAAIHLPVSTEPVSETMSTSSCATSAAPGSSPPATTLSTPGGQDSAGDSPSSSAVTASSGPA